jgi:hypothetical protein
MWPKGHFGIQHPVLSKIQPSVHFTHHPSMSIAMQAASDFLQHFGAQQLEGVT